MNTNFKLCCAIFSYVALAWSASAKLDTDQIQQLTGLKGTWNEEEKVFKISAPRDEVKVLIDKWAAPPFMGLTSWVSFTEGKSGEAMITGDLVLFQDEVNQVMSVLLENGVEITALNNHFFFDQPRVLFMHIGGEGTVTQLAGTIGKVMAKVKQWRKMYPQPKESGAGVVPSENNIPRDLLEKILGTKSESKDGMCKFVFGRTAKMSSGHEAGREMGVNSWVAFAGNDRFSVLIGDLALHEDELQSVLKSLRSHNINIVAIHNHMTGETPRMVFLHYSAKGRAETLAQAIKSALEVQNQKAQNK